MSLKSTLHKFQVQILEHFGLIWTVWTILDHMDRLDRFGPFEPFRPFWINWTILDSSYHIGPFWTNTNRFNLMGPY